jgi:hypothetical protein
VNVCEQLAKRIRSGVYRAQKGIAQSLVGRSVRRNGVEYHVVRLAGDKIVVSDLKTPLDQTTTFSVKAFLSKAVAPLSAEG